MGFKNESMSWSEQPSDMRAASIVLQIPPICQQDTKVCQPAVPDDTCSISCVQEKACLRCRLATEPDESC